MCLTKALFPQVLRPVYCDWDVCLCNMRCQVLHAGSPCERMGMKRLHWHSHSHSHLYASQIRISGYVSLCQLIWYTSAEYTYIKVFTLVYKMRSYSYWCLWCTCPQRQTPAPSANPPWSLPVGRPVQTTVAASGKQSFFYEQDLPAASALDLSSACPDPIGKHYQYISFKLKSLAKVNANVLSLKK